jgi:hypothetical protein
VIIAGQRIGERRKKPKDIAQSHAIVGAYRTRDPEALDDAFAAASRRGPVWRAAVNQLAEP